MIDIDALGGDEEEPEGPPPPPEHVKSLAPLGIVPGDDLFDQASAILAAGRDEELAALAALLPDTVDADSPLALVQLLVADQRTFDRLAAVDGGTSAGVAAAVLATAIR